MGIIGYYQTFKIISYKLYSTYSHDVENAESEIKESKKLAWAFPTLISSYTNRWLPSHTLS
jgi:hypothetical protein